MRLKIILIITALILIILLALFGMQVKDKMIKNLGSKTPNINCGESICTSCIIKGNTCNCGTDLCECGDITVKKEECEL